MGEIELSLDIDQRMEEIVRQAWAADPVSNEALVKLLRLAYAKGHQDALTEKNPKRFYRIHGFTPPKRIT